MSGIAVMQWDAQNAYHQVKLLAFNGILYVAVI